MMSCSDQERCEELGFDENPMLFEDNFFLQATINDSPWEANWGRIFTNSKNNFDDNLKLDIRGFNYGNCNLIDLILRLSFLDQVYSLNEKNLDPPFAAIFNYGGLNELVVSQRYDSLLTIPNFPNYLLIEKVDTLNSIMEGSFQLGLTKRYCFTFDDGTISGCNTPDYLEGEPLNIIVTEGSFRMPFTEL